MMKRIIIIVLILLIFVQSSFVLHSYTGIELSPQLGEGASKGPYSRLVDAKLSINHDKLAVVLESYWYPKWFEVRIYKLRGMRLINQIFFEAENFYYRGVEWIDNDHVLVMDRIIDASTGKTLLLKNIVGKYYVQEIRTPCGTCYKSGEIVELETNHKGILAILVYSPYDVGFEHQCIARCNYRIISANYTPGYFILYNATSNETRSMPIKNEFVIPGTYHKIQVPINQYDYTFSPDGKYIAFLNYTTIKIISIEGRILRELVIWNYTRTELSSIKVLWIGGKILGISKTRILVFDKQLSRVKEIPYPFVLSGDGFIYSVSPDNRYLAIISFENYPFQEYYVPSMVLVGLDNETILWYKLLIGITSYASYFPTFASYLTRHKTRDTIMDGSHIVAFSPNSSMILIPGYTYGNGDSPTRSYVVCIGINGERIWRTKPRNGILLSIQWVNTTTFLAEYLDPRLDGYFSTIVVYHGPREIDEISMLSSSYTIWENSRGNTDYRPLVIPLPRTMIYDDSNGRIILLNTWFPQDLGYDVLQVYNVSKRSMVYEASIPPGYYHVCPTRNGGIWVLGDSRSPMDMAPHVYSVVFVDPKKRLEGRMEFSAYNSYLRTVNDDAYIVVNPKSYRYSFYVPAKDAPSALLITRRPRLRISLPILLLENMGNILAELEYSRMVFNASSFYVYSVDSSHLLVYRKDDNETWYHIVDVNNSRMIVSLSNIQGTVLTVRNGHIYVFEKERGTPPRFYITILDNHLCEVRRIRVDTYNTTQIIPGPGGAGTKPVKVVYAIQDISLDWFNPILSPNGKYIVLYGLIGKYLDLPGLWHAEDVWDVFIVSLDNGTLYLIPDLMFGTKYHPTEHLDIIWSPGDSHITVINKYSNRITIYSIRDGVLNKTMVLREFGARLAGFRWIDNNSFVVYAVYRNYVDITRYSINGSSYWQRKIIGTGFKFEESPDGKYVVVYNRYGDIYIVDTNTGEYKYTKTRLIINSTSWLLDGKYFYAINRSGDKLVLAFYDIDGKHIDSLELDNKTMITELYDSVLFVKPTMSNSTRNHQYSSLGILVFNSVHDMIMFSSRIRSPAERVSPHYNSIERYLPIIDGIAALILVGIAIYYYIVVRRRL